MGDASLAAGSATPVDQILFHVRLIDPWRASPSSAQQSRWSFFGLELELRGHRQSATNGDAQVHVALNFDSTARSKQREDLRDVSPPFTVTVRSKMPLDVATDQQKPLLQLLVPVQTDNTLARINNIHFLRRCTTGADVFSALERVIDIASVARPCELTYLRHNHAQASAKIRAFAARADVQKAQVAQFEKLQADESKWPVERKRRKQFVLQQMDFYREHYLFDHIGAQLQSLHEEIMGGGQWHAYEFEKALWYYHAATGNLYAEHPMRNNEKTRELIGGVQICTRTAARKLQHGARRFLRVNRAANSATKQILDSVSDEFLKTVFDAAWEGRITSIYVDHLKSNTGKPAKAKKLWSKWTKRAVIRGEEPPSESSPDRSQDEEELACQAADRILTKTCEDILVSSIQGAWEMRRAETFVGHFKESATKKAKAKRLWKTWSKRAVDQAKSEEAQRLPRIEEKLTSAAIDQVLDALVDDWLTAEQSKAEKARTLARVEDQLARHAIERVFGIVFDDILASSVLSAWQSSVADTYVGHIKANATKTAKAKRLWEEWSHHTVTQAKADLERVKAEETLVHNATERMLSRICEEILNVSFTNAWEAAVGQLKADTTNSGKAMNLRDRSNHQDLAPEKVEPRIDHVLSPPPPPSSQPEPWRAIRRTEVASPESVDAELPITTESRAVAITPELPIITRRAVVKTPAAAGFAQAVEDDDDEEEIRSWRSRLRLLKQHQHVRRTKSPKRKAAAGNRHGNLVVAPRPLAGPMLVDRSSLLLDVAHEDNYYSTSTTVLSSLREPRRVPRSTYDATNDEALEEEDDGHVLASASAAPTSEWRRDSSFRSFHAFFNSTPSTSLLIQQQQRLQPPQRVSPFNEPSVSSSKYASAPSAKLPTMALRSPQPAPQAASTTAPSMASYAPSYASDKPASSSLAAPSKRLPYIRRRKP